MRLQLLIIAAPLFLNSCKKQDVVVPPDAGYPEMTYKSLNDDEVKYQKDKAVDVDNDGRNDFVFYTQLLGDPILQRDRLQFLVASGLARQLLNDTKDESPVLNHLDPITKEYPGYTWYELSSIVLTEKIITYAGTYWDGSWKSAHHQYLPIQVKNNGKSYHGWIELSFDSGQEKLILHKSAISGEADRAVKAGM